jgi:hypothetical protein
MPFFLYASFPNSRVKPRPSTQSANTYQVSILDQTQPLTLIAAPNANRTYIILKNLSNTTALWYVYASQTAINPTLVATLGVPNQLLYNPGTNTLYQKQDSGTTTNWLIVTIQQVGESIDQLQSATLDQLNDYIYAAAASALPVVPPVVIGVDEGRG